MDTDEHHQENREIKNPAVAMKPGAKCIISKPKLLFIMHSSHSTGNKKVHTHFSMYMPPCYINSAFDPKEKLPQKTSFVG